MTDHILTAPCRYCYRPTRSIYTHCCDACWELVSRVMSNPELARKVLREMSRGKREEREGQL